MRALYVMTIVSLCWPQVEPERDLRMLSLERALWQMELMWGVKVKWGSKVTPRILGVRHSASSDPSQVMCGLVRDWWVSGVKSVLEDLAMETVRPLLRAQSATSEECDDRVWEEWSMLVDVAIAVKSSEYLSIRQKVKCISLNFTVERFFCFLLSIIAPHTIAAER